LDGSSESAPPTVDTEDTTAPDRYTAEPGERLGTLVIEQKQDAHKSVSGAISETPPIPSYVQRYIDGESIQDIAKDHQVAARTIYRWIMSELGDGYQQVVTNVLVGRVADADMALEQAADVCQIARAREQARFARMDLERRRPHLYGVRQQITHEVGNNLGDLLRQARARVVQAQHAAALTPNTIDVTPTNDDQPSD
jgi:transposase-like protein